MEEIRQKVRGYVVDSFLFGNDAKLREDMSFLKSSLMDSTGMLELISYIEQEFGIRIEDAELVPENLDSIDKVVGFIERKSA